MHAGLSPANANVEDRGMEPRRREHRRPVLLRQLCIGRNYNGGREPSRRRRGIAQPSLPGRAQLDGANPGTRRSIEGEPLRCCRAWLAAQAKISPAPSPPADESRRFVMLRRADERFASQHKSRWWQELPQDCTIGYFAKISSTRLNAFSTAACGVRPPLMTSAQAIGHTCVFSTLA